MKKKFKTILVRPYHNDIDGQDVARLNEAYEDGWLPENSITNNMGEVFFTLCKFQVTHEESIKL